MRKKDKKPVSATACGLYTKSRIGYGSQAGVSMYELATRALARDGRPMPEGCTHRQWVYENAEHINAARPKKTRKAAASTPVLRSVPVAQKLANTKPVLPPQRATTVDVRSDEFLQSYEWRVLRMKALKFHGPRCQCCGATPADGAVMNVDHIKPRRLFPELALTLDNLQILCAPCNHGKSNWDQTDWRTPGHVLEESERGDRPRAVA